MTNVVKFFENVYGIKPDEGRECGYVILNNHNQQKEVIYDSSFEELVQDAFNKMGIKANADKLLRDRNEIKRGKTIPFLPMPGIGEHVTIKILSTPKVVDSRFNENGMIITRCKLIGYESEYNLIISSTIYNGMIDELRNYRVQIDDDMKCIVGLNFAITGIEWLSAPKHFWKNYRPPKIYSVRLLYSIRLCESK